MHADQGSSKECPEFQCVWEVERRSGEEGVGSAGDAAARVVRIEHEGPG